MTSTRKIPQSKFEALQRLIRTKPLPGGWYSSWVEDFESDFGYCSGISPEDARRSMEIYLMDVRCDADVARAL